LLGNALCAAYIAMSRRRRPGQVAVVRDTNRVYLDFERYSHNDWAEDLLLGAERRVVPASTLNVIAESLEFLVPSFLGNTRGQSLDECIRKS
jgi:hypothetical protein